MKIQILLLYFKKIKTIINIGKYYRRIIIKLNIFKELEVKNIEIEFHKNELKNIKLF